MFCKGLMFFLKKNIRYYVRPKQYLMFVFLTLKAFPRVLSMIVTFLKGKYTYSIKRWFFPLGLLDIPADIFRRYGLRGFYHVF